MPDLSTSIHACHATERNHIIDAFEQNLKMWKRAGRLKDCASHGKLYLEGDPPDVRLWIYRCCDRLCPLCARHRSRKVAKQLLTVFKSPGVTRHMVLTIRTGPEDDLEDSLRHLRESFTRLRRTSEWKTKVSGGAYVVEITRNAKTGGWHPHLHLLIRGSYFPVKLLSGLWIDASNGSTDVFISAANEKSANHLAKYASKPPKLETWPKEAVCVYAQATKSTRMVQMFGDMHSVKLEDSDHQAEPAATRSCISLSVLRTHAMAGQPAAVALLRATAARWPRLWEFLRCAVDLPPPRALVLDQVNIDRLQKAVNHSAKYVIPLCEPIKPYDKKIYVSS